MPVITDAVGLGDSFATFRERHGPCTGPSGTPLKVSADGTSEVVFCGGNRFMPGAMFGIVDSLTLQYEADEYLPRKVCEATALRHAPRDRRKIRSFTDTLSSAVAVYRSGLLAKNLRQYRNEVRARNLPDSASYRGDDAIFSVEIHGNPGESTCYGVSLHLGVAEDDGDPAQ